MTRRRTAYWVMSMWGLYGLALGGVVVHRWWLVPVGLVAGTASAVKA